jgi:hypothetical protein
VLVQILCNLEIVSERRDTPVFSEVSVNDFVRVRTEMVGPANDDGQ